MRLRLNDLEGNEMEKEKFEAVNRIIDEIEAADKELRKKLALFQIEAADKESRTGQRGYLKKLSPGVIDELLARARRAGCSQATGVESQASRVMNNLSDGRCCSCKLAIADTKGHHNAPPGFAICGSAKFTQGAQSGSEPDELRYSYDEGGSFYVGPQFGCVHWERK